MICQELDMIFAWLRGEEEEKDEEEKEKEEELEKKKKKEKKEGRRRMEGHTSTNRLIPFFIFKV